VPDEQRDRPRRNLRVGLNLLHSMPEVGGVWNYVRAYVRGLASCDAANSYVAYVTRQSLELVPQCSNFTVVMTSCDPRQRWRRVLYENTVLQRLAIDDNLDCMHWFANTGAVVPSVPSVVTVHDIMVYARPRAFSVSKRLYLKSMLRLTARDSRRTFLCAVSEATAAELSSRLNVRRERVQVLPFILDGEFQRVSEDAVASFKARRRLPERFWLCVGHTYSHKNHGRLLEAYARLRAAAPDTWPLVVRGDPRDGEESVSKAIREFGLEPHVLRLPRLGEAELPLLYSAAECTVFPSLYEGLGIPVLEAMACGCPVAVSDLPSVRECAADAGLYFEPREVQSIQKAMMAMQKSAALRQELREKGYRRARNHTTKKVIPAALAVYRRAASSRQP